MQYETSALEKLYQEIDKKIAIFVQATKITCVPGCGDCCLRFEPYISLLEATLVANYLLLDQNAMQHFIHCSSDKTKILCPFFLQDNPLHCGIYSIRPLICRLFAFSAKKKEGCLEYEACHAIQKEFPQKVEEAVLFINHGLVIPIYREEYRKLCAIDPILATDLHPLSRSVEIAVNNPEIILDKNNNPKDYSRYDLLVPFSVFIRKHINNL